MADIEIEIDGKKLTAKPDQMVIQVADANGIYIPRFCYHKHLTVAANCRMCLVEVEKSPKALPACATPVAPGMKIFTRSQKTIEAQRAVMEFLLINHPLDCPICDQGGECELQDLSMGYGSSHSSYDECKRANPDLDLGPLVATEMTRCIYCTRCVRYGTEIAGVRELGATFRGQHTEITTYVQHTMKSEVAGNIIDLCPVGALTSKPFRFSARAWELDQAPGISPHDCLGTNIHTHQRYGKIMRVVSRENAAINETWITDRDRFSYTGLYHEDRLTKPMIRKGQTWQEVEWQEALELTVQQLQQVITASGANQIGALASPNSTIEEFYLLQKLMRGLGSHNIDHRLRQMDFEDQDNVTVFPGLTGRIADLENCEVIFLIGTNIQKEQPLLALRIRKAIKKGAIVLALNPIDYDFNFTVTEKDIVAPQHMVKHLEDIVAAIQSNTVDQLINANHKAMASALQNKKSVAILLGALALNHQEASHLRYLAAQLAQSINGQLGFLTEGANAAGAWLSGCIPHRNTAGEKVNQTGFTAYQMLTQALKAYVLLNVEPELDTANANASVHALAQAEFVVALSSYRNPTLDKLAHVILPVAAFTETAGTYVNTEGVWQSFTGAASAFHSARPAWKVLRVLGNFLQLPHFDYGSAEAVKHEVKSLVERMSVTPMTFSKPQSLRQKTASLTRIGEIPIYAVDSLVRRATPLQQTQAITEGDVCSVSIHPETAKKWQLQDAKTVKVRQQSAETVLTLHIDERVSQEAAWIAGGIPETSQLGDLFGEVEITKMSTL